MRDTHYYNLGKQLIGYYMGIQFSINYNENLNKAHKLEGAWVWTFNDNSSYISRNLKLDYWRLSHSKWEFHNKALASNWNFPSFAKLWYSWFVNSLLIDYSKNYQRKSYPFHYELFVPLHWFFFFFWKIGPRRDILWSLKNQNYCTALLRVLKEIWRNYTGPEATGWDLRKQVSGWSVKYSHRQGGSDILCKSKTKTLRYLISILNAWGLNMDI